MVLPQPTPPYMYMPRTRGAPCPGCACSPPELCSRLLRPPNLRARCGARAEVRACARRARVQPPARRAAGPQRRGSVRVAAVPGPHQSRASERHRGSGSSAAAARRPPGALGLLDAHVVHDGQARGLDRRRVRVAQLLPHLLRQRQQRQHLSGCARSAARARRDASQACRRRRQRQLGPPAELGAWPACAGSSGQLRAPPARRAPWRRGQGAAGAPQGGAHLQLLHQHLLPVVWPVLARLPACIVQAQGALVRDSSRRCARRSCCRSRAAAAGAGEAAARQQLVIVCRCGQGAGGWRWQLMDAGRGDGPGSRAGIGGGGRQQLPGGRRRRLAAGAVQVERRRAPGRALTCREHVCVLPPPLRELRAGGRLLPPRRRCCEGDGARVSHWHRWAQGGAPPRCSDLAWPPGPCAAPPPLARASTRAIRARARTCGQAPLASEMAGAASAQQVLAQEPAQLRQAGRHPIGCRGGWVGRAAGAAVGSASARAVSSSALASRPARGEGSAECYASGVGIGRGWRRTGRWPSAAAMDNTACAEPAQGGLGNARPPASTLLLLFRSCSRRNSSTPASKAYARAPAQPPRARSRQVCAAARASAASRAAAKRGALQTRFPTDRP
jgi:hypothetical protein